MKVRITQLTEHGMCANDQWDYPGVPLIGSEYECEWIRESDGAVRINGWHIGKADYEVVEA